MMSIFSFAGGATAAASLFVCSDWLAFLTSNDALANTLWKDLATQVGIESKDEGDCRSRVIQNATKDARRKKANAMASLAEQLRNNFGTGKGLCLR